MLNQNKNREINIFCELFWTNVDISIYGGSIVAKDGFGLYSKVNGICSNRNKGMKWILKIKGTIH